MALNVFIAPNFPGSDKGEGGIRRVVEAQQRWLPKFGFEVTPDLKKADIVALHAGEWVTPEAGVPVVSHCHGLYWSEHEWSTGIHRINDVVLKNIKQADAVTVPSEWVRYALARDTWIDAQVLCHGIEPDEWTELAGNEGYVLWNKNRPDATCDPTPVTELARRAPKTQFLTTFIGKDGERENTRVLGRESYPQSKDRVRHAGVYLATARETFGIGTLEAMAAGVPILGYNWGGQSEIVIHKEHGFLAEPGDYDGLAEGLEYIQSHREYLSTQARAHVLKEFTWEHWIEQYAKLYDRLISEHRGPRVSIVITNYNLGRYLGEAVASAKAAIKEADCTGEIIVVDDASTEPMPREINDDAGILRITNPKNLHVSGSLNVGFTAARGRYILSLDADNHLKNLSVLVKALDADRGLDIAYGKMAVFGDGHQRSWVSTWPPQEASLEKQLQHHNQIPSTSLCRRRIFQWVGGYRERGTPAEDADFWCRALAVGAKARRVTDQVTLEYRDRSDSVSRVNNDWMWNSWYHWTLSDNRLATIGGPIKIHDKPLISIVIPVGPGHERLVLDAIDSVQAQSQFFDGWECIVVNDSGNDLKFVPPWARVIPGGKLGVSHARNRGMLLSHGEYVLFLDADDYLHPQALYHFYHTATTSNCPNVYVYSDWFEAETGTYHQSPDFNPKTVFEKLASPVTAMYKKWDLQKNNVLWDETFKEGWEDWDFAIQVAAKAGLCGVRINAPLLHYRLNSGTLRKIAQEHAPELKLKVNFKWADYISGEKQNRSEQMPGCGGCGGGRYPSLANAVPRSTGMFDNVDLDKETTLIEYTPPPDWTGVRSFLGRKTGNRYRFGVDANNKVRRVYNVDVPGLEAIGYFRKVSSSGVDPGAIVPLAAPGPPKNEPETITVVRGE